MKTYVWALLLAAAMPAAAQEAVESIGFGGWVELSAAGEVEKFEPSQRPPLSNALRPIVIKQVRAADFVPAQGAAGPVASRSWLDGRVQMIPNGENVIVRTANLKLGPRVISRAAPRYPEALRETAAELVLVFTVTTAGRAGNFEVLAEPTVDPAFGQAAITALHGWRFDPEQRDGKPAASRMQLWFRFLPDGTPGGAAVAPLPVPEGRAQVVGQDASVELVEVRAGD